MAPLGAGTTKYQQLIQHTPGAIGPNSSFWTARSQEWLQGCVVLIMGEWLLIWSQNGSFYFVCVSYLTWVKHWALPHRPMPKGMGWRGSAQCKTSLLQDFLETFAYNMLLTFSRAVFTGCTETYISACL